MPRYALYTDNLNSLQRENRRALIAPKTKMKALLGDNDGNIYVPKFNGNRVYVRLAGNADTNSQNAYNQVTVARLTGAPYFEYRDAPILVSYDDDGNLIVIGIDYTRAEQAELSIPTLNVGTAQNKYVDLTESLIGISRPVSNGTNTSTRIGINPIIYDVYNDYKVFAGTPLQADKPDLSSYIPSAGYHRIVQVWLDSYNNAIELTASTSQLTTTGLDNTDVVEAWSTRFQDWIPLQSYRLSNAQTAVTMDSLWRDHRQWVNTPSQWGVPTVLDCNYRIWDNREVVVTDTLDLSDYTLVIESGSRLVQNGGASGDGSNGSNLVTKTTNYTATITDDTILCNGSLTITLPTAIGNKGKRFNIKNIGTGAVTIDGNGSETIDDSASATLSVQYISVTIVSDGTEWFII